MDLRECTRRTAFGVRQSSAHAKKLPMSVGKTVAISIFLMCAGRSLFTQANVFKMINLVDSLAAQRPSSLWLQFLFVFFLLGSR